jgi:hypothetical protein
MPTNIDKIATVIENDEQSVLASGAGRGRLLDDLRSVPASQVRDVFNRVLADDESMGKQTVIDERNGLLIISDPYPNGSKSETPARSEEAAKAQPASDPPKQEAPHEKTLLQTVKAIHDDMPWYERVMIEGGIMYEIGQVNDMAKAAIAKHAGN